MAFSGIFFWKNQSGVSQSAFHSPAGGEVEGDCAAAARAVVAQPRARAVGPAQRHAAGRAQHLRQLFSSSFCCRLGFVWFGFVSLVFVFVFVSFRLGFVSLQ